jgi:hypothetical protein
LVGDMFMFIPQFYVYVNLFLNNLIIQNFFILIKVIMGLIVYFFYQSPKELNIEVPGKGEKSLMTR